MHICRKVNLASSSSWMYIAYILYWLICVHPLLIFLFRTKRGRKLFCIYFNPFVDDWQKGGEVFQYICMFWKKGFMFMHSNKKNLMCFMLVYACLSPYMFWAFIAYLFIYCDAWVKGELLWSLTLIHAYITPWVLSSSKRGRLLARRPFTLVLMMINSCCYVY